MFRGTTCRLALAAVALAVLALQLFTPAGPFASAHTFGQAVAKAEPGLTVPATPVRDGAETFRAPGRTGEPASVPHVRDRQRGSASGWAQEHPLITGRAAEAAASEPSDAPWQHAPRLSRTGTPAALQVFRC
ncbi:hypothetical protein NX794_13330 [Streptomyces sp. LP11]|uniref:Secreted protein n=1 Tax=Streptomyces pyxinicus TaxID=2970331 RepID=A0ABT2B182_9ACTN|nr:hypothetical protein [Streptomyces sp. LP11]MCS0602180.1 hypothetical protein [Streptomyces sp. LP11]